MKALPAPPLVIDVERPIRAGILFVVIGFFGFLAWAALAPITSAAVAPGVVVADSRNKDIQHLEGGIIREVLVREGDRVSAGQVLVRLDSATADANLGRLQARSARPSPPRPASSPSATAPTRSPSRPTCSPPPRRIPRRRRRSKASRRCSTPTARRRRASAAFSASGSLSTTKRSKASRRK